MIHLLFARNGSGCGDGIRRQSTALHPHPEWPLLQWQQKGRSSTGMYHRQEIQYLWKTPLYLSWCMIPSRRMKRLPGRYTGFVWTSLAALQECEQNTANSGWLLQRGTTRMTPRMGGRFSPSYRPRFRTGRWPRNSHVIQSSYFQKGRGTSRGL